jgi:ribosome-associated heat shock protein Hsp15
METEGKVSVRIDRYLTATRLFKSRALAQEACDGGHTKLNGNSVRASHPVKRGDRIETLCPRGKVILVVLDLEEKRASPVRARQLYEDHSPPPPPKDLSLPERARGSGRPTKQERRHLERFRGGF